MWGRPHAELWAGWTQLGQAVADNLLALDQKWWLRLATRNDAATTAEGKQRLSSLASTVMALMDVSPSPATRGMVLICRFLS